MKNLQDKIINHLKSSEIPDFEFLYNEESLKQAPAILERLLNEEKEEFEKLMNTDISDVTFDQINKDELLEYYYGLLSHYESVESIDIIRTIIEDFEPKYLAFSQEVSYSKKYYEILKHLVMQDYDEEIKRILTKQIEAFERRGIHLQEDKQNRLKEIGLELSELSQKFGQNLIDAESEFEYLIKDKKDIEGLPVDIIEAAKHKYADKNPKSKEDGFIFGASAGEYLNIMKYCSNSDIRKDFYIARQEFGSAGKYDNKPLISKILSLRNEKAQILGLKDYNELSLQTKMANNIEEILDFFDSVLPSLQKKSKTEKEDLEKFAGKTLKAWDQAYYSTQFKEQNLKIDDKEIRKYFPYEHVRTTMFEFANKLYDLDFDKVNDHNYFQDNGGELWKVYNKGEFVSYLLIDPYYREKKQAGAWANIIREISDFDGTKLSKITINVTNIVKNKSGDTLLTLREVETLFHEFGHAMHAMLGKSKHPQLGGFGVEWDFIELPSQLNENWVRHPDGLAKISSHYQTGEAIPDELVEKLEASKFFGIGRFILTQISYASLDLKLHSKTWKEDELLDLVLENYKSVFNESAPEGYFFLGGFRHIFDGGYAAGYYSYLWAEILEKDVWEAFLNTGDIFDKAQATKYKQNILEAGSIKDSAELYYEFMGRKLSREAFLRQNNIIK